jgi:hypothetical protein
MKNIYLCTMLQNDVRSGIWGIAIEKIFYGVRENFSWRSRKTGMKERVRGLSTIK